MTKVIVKANGKIYDGFKSVRIERSIDAISSAFGLDFKDSWGPRNELFGLNPQDEVTIEIAGKPMITGYIERFKGGQREANSYDVEGRDITADLIDCSCPTTPAQYKGMTLLALCERLAIDTGIKFKLGPNPPADVLKPFPSWTPQPGESIFDSIERACRMKGVLLYTDGTGQVIIGTTGIRRAATPLIEGENVKELSFSKDYSDRYSDYIVRGQDQTTEGFNGTTTTVRGTAKDAGVRRKRLLVMQAESRSTTEQARARAQWEATVRAARSLKVSATVFSWLDGTGQPWELNSLVDLKAPKLGIEGTFLISSTSFTLSEAGSETRLTLLRPDAFTSEPVVPKTKADQTAKGFQVRK